DGFVAVAVPDSGQYTVRLNEKSFPDGVTFAKDAPTELKPIVLGQNDRPVIFRLTDAEQSTVSGPTTFERVASLLASGLRFGLVIALAAVGLSLIFGTTGLTNFAHGELLTFGAMATWYLNSNNGGLGLPLIIAAVGGVAVSAVFGASFDVAVYRPLRRRGMPIISQMVVSIGLALATRYFFAVIFGSNTKQFSQYAAQPPSIDLGPVALRPKDVVIIIVAFLALIAVGLFLQRSRLGTAIRAVSDNPSLAIASGINDNRVILLVWAFAGALGGLAGVMLGATEGVNWNMGQHVLLVMFAAVLLGGLGTTFGAMVGGIFVGVVSDLSTFWLDSDLKIVVALATLVLVLLVKPTGVFGVRVRKA
ncbi:MAG: branched-chain amino acid ABC transporter permease, partial [Microthrixaceae bacterium]|nr:branched-chain amino acid ABC transporter permease [Microthrixaceae bacterium]